MGSRRGVGGRAALSAAVLGVMVAAGEAGEPRAVGPITVLWIDLTEGAPVPWDLARRRVEAVLGSLGARIAWTSTPAGGPIRSGHDLRVILLPSPPSVTPPGPLLMGCTPGGPAANTARVYVEHIARVLGYPDVRAAGHRAETRLELARAVGTVISHELVHLLTPGRSHASRGLMTEQLRRRDLVSSAVEIDPESRAAAVATLRPLMIRKPVASVAAGS